MIVLFPKSLPSNIKSTWGSQTNPCNNPNNTTKNVVLEKVRTILAGANANGSTPKQVANPACVIGQPTVSKVADRRRCEQSAVERRYE